MERAIQSQTHTQTHTLVTGAGNALLNKSTSTRKNKAWREQRAHTKKRTQRHSFTIAVIFVFGNTAGSPLACLLKVYNPALLSVTWQDLVHTPAGTATHICTHQGHIAALD